jgi:hypothetical protein
MVELARQQGLRVFYAIEEVPGCELTVNGETAI